MICQPCRQAGDLNANNNAAAAVGKATGTQFAIRNLHKTCEAPTTCPCQHRLGSFTTGGK